MTKLKLGCTKILQAVLSSGEGERAAVSLHARRRNSPHFSHTLEDMSGFQLVSPLVNPRTADTIQALLVCLRKEEG